MKNVETKREDLGSHLNHLNECELSVNVAFMYIDFMCIYIYIYNMFYARVTGTTYTKHVCMPIIISCGMMYTVYCTLLMKLLGKRPQRNYQVCDYFEPCIRWMKPYTALPRTIKEAREQQNMP